MFQDSPVVLHLLTSSWSDGRQHSSLSPFRTVPVCHKSSEPLHLPNQVSFSSQPNWVYNCTITQTRVFWRSRFAGLRLFWWKWPVIDKCCVSREWMSSERRVLTRRKMRNGGVLTRTAKGYDCRHEPYARTPPSLLPHPPIPLSISDPTQDGRHSLRLGILLRRVRLKLQIEMVSL